MLSRQQLWAVFTLCDPQGTGFVSLEQLLHLAREYCRPDNHQDVEAVLRRLDPQCRGKIGFQDFCIGVSTLLAGGEENMMAPTLGPQTPSFVLTGAHMDDADSAIGDSTSPDLNAKSQCSSMSDAENLECFGAVDLELEDAGTASSPPDASLTRNTWLRTSLRRTPSSNPGVLPNRRWGSFRHSGKRLGSNALASQLYRSSSFNSSGRSSTCDTADDMYSDASLEEDVLDLNHKVQMLQQQVNVLADNQTNNDDRYTRAKQDSAALQARVLMLEEQLREAELRAEERLQEEQKRHRELMVRVEREKQLEIENVSIRLEAAETEAANQREEVSRLRNEILQLNWDNHSLLEQLHESESMLDALKSEADDFRELIRKLKEEVNHEKSTGSQLAAELALEVEELRKEQESHQCSRVSEATQEDMEARILELQVELNNLRQQNKSLQESNEELQAQMLTRSVEEGRTLLTNSNSLAAEFEAMSQDDQKAGGEDHNSLEQMKSALKEQQEVNSQLRSYIDGILLNIVENYPQLLEVKTH